MKKTLRKIAYGVLGLALLMGALWVRPKLFDDELCFVPQKPVDWEVNDVQRRRLRDTLSEIGPGKVAPVVTPELEACMRECLANPESTWDVYRVVGFLGEVRLNGGTVPEAFRDAGMLRAAMAKGWRNELYLFIAESERNDARFSGALYRGSSSSSDMRDDAAVISSEISFAWGRTLAGISFMPNRTYNLQWRMIERFENDPGWDYDVARRSWAGGKTSWVNFYGETEVLYELWRGRRVRFTTLSDVMREIVSEGTCKVSAPKAGAKAAPVAGE